MRCRYRKRRKGEDMSRWRKSSGKQYDLTLTKKIIKERACKVCGSTKWVCYSEDRGQTWTCWGHRSDATPEQREKEDQRQREEHERKEQIRIKGQVYRQKVQHKRHAKNYTPKTSQYDWLFD